MNESVYDHIIKVFNVYKHDPDVFNSSRFSIDCSVSTKIEIYSLYGLSVLVVRSDQFELRIEKDETSRSQKLSVHIFEHEYPIWELRLGGYRSIFFADFKNADEFEMCFKNFRKYFPEMRDALYRLMLEMV